MIKIFNFNKFLGIVLLLTLFLFSSTFAASDKGPDGGYEKSNRMNYIEDRIQESLDALVEPLRLFNVQLFVDFDYKDLSFKRIVLSGEEGRKDFSISKIQEMIEEKIYISEEEETGKVPLLEQVEKLRALINEHRDAWRESFWHVNAASLREKRLYLEFLKKRNQEINGSLRELNRTLPDDYLEQSTVCLQARSLAQEALKRQREIIKKESERLYGEFILGKSKS